MKNWKHIGLGLFASLAINSNVHAQVEGPAAVAVATAPARNLWSFFCMTPEQAARCKEKLCNSPLGEMAKSAAKPMSLMSGGLLFGKCGTPTAEDLAKMKAEGKLDSAEGTAAQIKKSEAEAKARREAIRYLGTVDCNYWPEAKAALINGLRADPNECVRYEAALALLRGCCCNKDVMKALKHSANGSDKDNFPAENSGRVRETASAALAHCAAVYAEIEVQVQLKLKEVPGPGKEVPAPQKEAGTPPLTSASPRGKGLAGIVAVATNVPPAAPPARVEAAPFRNQVAAPVTTYVPHQFVQQPESKKGLLQMIGSSTGRGSVETRDAMLPERTAPMATDASITPVGYRPLPLTPAQKAVGPITTPSPGTPIIPITDYVRPPQANTVTPSRGVVVFDGNGAR